jgi:hypothetical protein
MFDRISPSAAVDGLPRKNMLSNTGKLRPVAAHSSSGSSNAVRRRIRRALPRAHHRPTA